MFAFIDFKNTQNSFFNLSSPKKNIVFISTLNKVSLSFTNLLHQNLYVFLKIGQTTSLSNRHQKIKILLNNTLHTAIQIHSNQDDYCITIQKQQLHSKNNILDVRTITTCSDMFISKLYLSNFYMQLQEKTNWCWAAVTTSISKYYDSNSTYNQKQIVEKMLSIPCMCNNQSTCSLCNKPYFLGEALETYGVLKKAIPNRISKKRLKQELKNNRIVVIAIKWNNSATGHLLTISHYHTKKYVVWDSKKIYPEFLTYSQLKKQEKSTWVNTFLSE